MLKIDVEGMKEQTLNRARDLITRCRPYIYVENNPTESSKNDDWKAA